MNILIIGCQNVGSTLANSLSRLGHEVSIVDQHMESFRYLDSDFTGITVAGVPIDQDVLRRAGIEGCDAVAAVTSDDNINVMVSQLAKEIFNVPKVLARVYDPRREDVFSHFGLHTICPTNLTVNSIVSILTDRDEIKHLTFDASTLAFTTVRVPKRFSGFKVSKIDVGEDEVLLGVLHHDGNITLLSSGNDFTVYATDRLVLVKNVE